jgi:chromate transporter
VYERRPAAHRYTPPRVAHGVSFREATKTFARIGVESFGGPAGQIAVMHRVLVEEKRWVSEERFLHALNYCMLLPGPEATQLVTYVGWLLHGTAGGLVAGVLFVLPGFVALLALSIVYAAWSKVAAVDAMFFGLKAAVLAVVVEAVIRLGRRALKTRWHAAIAAAAFIAIFFFDVPFPVLVLAAGALGLVAGRIRPDVFAAAAKDGGARTALSDDVPEHAKPNAVRTLRTALAWLAAWWLPVGAVILVFGATSVFAAEALFFSKTSVVTFGGAYSVLAYVAQRAVAEFHWLRPGEMLDGLGMAETTPGPLIQVLQFVGFLGAYRNPGGMNPWAAGVLGSLVTTWVTYVPCFLWIFVGAPYIEALRGSRALTSALSAITAAVVGVILNLAVWFALHALFGAVEIRHAGALRLYVPEWATVSWPSVAIAAAAAVALLRFKAGMMWTLAGAAAAGVLVRLM